MTGKGRETYTEVVFHLLTWVIIAAGIVGVVCGVRWLLQ